ncbi:hypothetical protein ACROYT_G024319 [Oculina patagonica]
MGSGASSNPVRSTVNAGLAAARWRSNAHSTLSSNSSANAPQENETEALTSDGNLDGIKVEGRTIKGNSNKNPAANSTQAVTKQQKAKQKSGETKSAATATVKPSQFGNKNKSTAKKNVKTVETKKSSTNTALKSKGQKKSVQVSTGSDLYQRVERVLHGFIEESCPVNSKTIRIFLSSTFTDTEHERNALMENVYPKLREFCQKKGYEFQVVDMRWGVRDDATDTHMTTELCLGEIKACQEISIGPNFVTLLSEKYGYRPLLPSIDAQEFDLLLNTATDVQTKELMDKWYKKDENCFPASYILQPVTTWIPNYFNDNDPSLKQAAQTEWRSEYNKMREFLQQAARKVFKDKDHDLWHKYVRSVCEVEIEYGLLQTENHKRSCVWFH